MQKETEPLPNLLTVKQRIEAIEKHIRAETFAKKVQEMSRIQESMEKSFDYWIRNED